MKPEIEALKRSYERKKLAQEKLDSMLVDGAITRVEYDYIIS